MLHLDHLVISGETRDTAADATAATLGVSLLPGGAHDHFATHNHLLKLDDRLYLETISIDPSVTPRQSPRWFGLDSFEGPPRLTNWVCRTDDLDTLVRDLPEAGTIVALQRGDLKWRMAVPVTGQTPYDGGFPALMQWDTDTHPTETLSESGCALDCLTIYHPQADRLHQRLSPYLDDGRIHFEQGSPHLSARVICPAGEKTLT